MDESTIPAQIDGQPDRRPYVVRVYDRLKLWQDGDEQRIAAFAQHIEWYEKDVNTHTQNGTTPSKELQDQLDRAVEHQKFFRVRHLKRGRDLKLLEDEEKMSSPHALRLASQRGILALESLPTCPRGHRLTEAPDQTWWSCDFCESDFGQTTPRRWCCARCDYDFCPTCIARKQIDLELEKSILISNEPHHQALVRGVVREHRLLLRDREHEFLNLVNEARPSVVSDAVQEEYLADVDRLRKECHDELSGTVGVIGLLVALTESEMEDHRSSSENNELGGSNYPTGMNSGVNRGGGGNMIRSTASSEGPLMAPSTGREKSSGGGGIGDTDDRNDTVKCYEVRRNCILGQGGFGTVYRAFDHGRGRHLAVKVSKIADQTKARSLLDEFNMLIKLSHDHIVRVYDCELDDTEARIFMEWMPAGSVADMLYQANAGSRSTRGGGLSRLHEYTIRRILIDCLRGLVYLHSRGIIHRDVKPANILCADRVFKLSDFGTCRYSMQSTGHSIAGTRFYMSEEALQANATTASDIWALACSVLEMAEGRPPWYYLPAEIRNHEMTFGYYLWQGHKERGEPHHPIIPQHISLPLQTILLRCFDQDPNRRPSAEDLIRDPYFSMSEYELERLEGMETLPSFLQRQQQQQQQQQQARPPQFQPQQEDEDEGGTVIENYSTSTTTTTRCGIAILGAPNNNQGGDSSFVSTSAATNMARRGGRNGNGSGDYEGEDTTYGDDGSLSAVVPLVLVKNATEVPTQQGGGGGGRHTPQQPPQQPQTQQRNTNGVRGSGGKLANAAQAYAQTTVTSSSSSSLWGSQRGGGSSSSASTAVGSSGGGGAGEGRISGGGGGGQHFINRDNQRPHHPDEHGFADGGGVQQQQQQQQQNNRYYAVPSASTTTTTTTTVNNTTEGRSAILHFGSNGGGGGN